VDGSISLTKRNVLRFVCTDKGVTLLGGRTLSSIAKKTRLPVFFLYGTPAHFLSMAYPITSLKPSLFLAGAFHFRIWSKSTAFLVTTSSHLPLCSPTGLLPPKSPSISFQRTSGLSILASDIQPVFISYFVQDF
jgi:hypothetical protein